MAPENLFPENYGSHPNELKNLILKAREATANRLVDRNYFSSKAEAEKEASKLIRATFDIGHVNIWKKYMVPKHDNETEEERDKRFSSWLMEKLKPLMQEDEKGNAPIIGHIHVSDNFGFHDEHLTAGDGNAPIKEFVQLAKQNGFDEFIVESGSLNPNITLPDTWAFLNSPVYAMGRPTVGTPVGWSNFYQGYFGRTEGPRFIVGSYAPSEEFKGLQPGSPFYSGLSLE